MTEPDNEKKPVGDPPRKRFDPNGPIGRKLKSFYDVVESETVPDRLLDLLHKLDEAESKSSGRS